ncbi:MULTISPECIES: CheR family methyltransferase [unclassified Halomonas]|uniref:CheR family methyltransferase n=1 Tax=unclassified Halomonas TaxID=2609666 RepID=UPI0020767F17|nr:MULTISPECIES: CheR family methyltransferase [unclassified Halomonas]
MSAYAPFKRLVHERYGLHLEGLHEARLVQAVKALRDATGETQPAALVERLRQNSALFDDFISRLTVNETYFYREPKALGWLAERYLPARLGDKAPPLRILSAGCSSGEEPYSLAMLLTERFGDRARTLFHITAGDVDQQALARARCGCYRGMAFRALPETLKARYFTFSNGHYEIDASFKEWIDFRVLNVLDADESDTFDVILFRNVSIYFDEPTRAVIQRRLGERLTPGGILLCGVAETLGNDLGVLALNERDGVFYFHHADQPIAPLATAPRPSEPRPQPVRCDNVSSARAPTKADVSSPAPSATPEVALAQQLHQAHAHLDHNRFDQAQVLLDALLDEHPWNVDALLLAGLVARWQQKPAKAQAYFKRALYVAPQCWPAHFYQAELFRAGELSHSPGQPRRGYEATLRLLSASPASRGGLADIRSPLAPGDACFLARSHLDEVVRSARRGD